MTEYRVEESYQSVDGTSGWGATVVGKFPDAGAAVAFARQYAAQHRPPKPSGRARHYRLVEVLRIADGIGVCIWWRRYPEE